MYHEMLFFFWFFVWPFKNVRTILSSGAVQTGGKPDWAPRLGFADPYPGLTILSLASKRTAYWPYGCFSYFKHLNVVLHQYLNPGRNFRGPSKRRTSTQFAKAHLQSCCCQINFCWNKYLIEALLRGFIIKWKIPGIFCQFHWRLKDFVVSPEAILFQSDALKYANSLFFFQPRSLLDFKYFVVVIVSLQGSQS